MQIIKTLVLTGMALVVLGKTLDARAEVNVLSAEVFDEITEKVDIKKDDIKQYKNIFRALDENDLAKADELVAGLENDILLGHVLAEKYLHPKYKSSCEELESWLERSAG